MNKPEVEQSVEAASINEMYLARFADRVQARLGARRAQSDGFTRAPEPFEIGDIERGERLMAGHLDLPGEALQLERNSLWRLTPDAPQNIARLHAFMWLDDLVAVGSTQARSFAQKAVAGWMGRFAKGSGPGWAPRTTARRLLRLMGHERFLLKGLSAEEMSAYYDLLAQHVYVLARRSDKVSLLQARLECYGALGFGALLLKGQGRYADAAIAELAQLCSQAVDDDGAIATRNPEALAEMFVMLVRLQKEIAQSHRPPVEPIDQAITRMAPTVRAVRHVDGSLMRAHGGGRGARGMLDSALAVSGVREQPAPRLHMGYARLNAPRLSLLIDAAVPPIGENGLTAHASTLAFEATAGRYPLVVSCGPGEAYGEKWALASRATASHSTVVLDGKSSSRFGEHPGKNPQQVMTLVERPEKVPHQARRITGGVRFEAAHDGYSAAYGLTHARRIEIAETGQKFAGEDMLATVNDAGKALFAERLAAQPEGLLMETFFHLHPDVDVEPGDVLGQYRIYLPNDDIWLFEHNNECTSDIQPSFYLQKGLVEPEPSVKLRLTRRCTQQASRMRWWFTKA